MKRSMFLILFLILLTASYCFGMQRYRPIRMRPDLDNPQIKALRVNLVEPARKEGWLSTNTQNLQPLGAEGWITYFTSFNLRVWKIGRKEGATKFTMSNFSNVTYPFWIKKLKCLFYEYDHPAWRWTDTTVIFKIYGNDGSTVLYDSAVEAKHHPIATELNLGRDSVKIESGDFWVAFDPGDSTPTALSDSGTIRNHSYAGGPGNWHLLHEERDTSRYEWSISAYVAWEAGTEETGIEPNIEIDYISNPVKGYISILYTIPTKTHVSIKLYDITGRIVATLEDGVKLPGKYEVIIDPASTVGVYFCKFRAGEFSKTKKIILL